MITVIMHKSRRVKITDINPHLSCVLCKGYLIDATTIIECLHSFCRSCIVKYLECNKYCPICDVQVHKTKPLLNIRSDQTLQDIVYKLVPGLFQNEMCRRRDFYAKHPDHKPSSAEESGQVTQFSHIYTADESISLSLEYYNNNDSLDNDNNSSDTKLKAHPSRRYLRCPAAVSVAHLQKLIRAKYGLSCEHRVDILYLNDKLNEDFTLMDIAYIYLWRRKGPLHLTYRIFEVAKRIKLHEPVKEESEIKVKEEKSIEEPCSNRKWKEVQLQISENGIMSVTNIEEAKPELVTSNVVEVKTELNLLKPELSELEATAKIDKGPVIETVNDVKVDVKTDDTTSTKESKLGKHKLQECSEDKPPQGKIMRANFSRPIILKNVQQLSRNHPLKIHSQLVAKSNNASSQPVSGTQSGTNLNAKVLQLPIKTSCTNQNTSTLSTDKTINNNNNGKPSVPSVQKELTTTLPNTVHSSTPPVQSTPKTVGAVTTSQCPLADKNVKPAPNCVTTSASSTASTISTSATSSPAPSYTSEHSSFGSNSMPNIPKYTQAGQSNDNTTTASIKSDTILQNSIAKPPPVSTASVTHVPPNNCIQSSKVSIVPKKTPIKLGAPIGYKTLRDPPKAWNPQISRQNLVKTNVYNSNNGASTSDIAKPDNRTPTKPNKFFKRNMPRYLGNPASGVKPMYQVRDGDKSPPESKKVPDLKKPAFDNKNNNNNKEDNKTRTDTMTENKNRQQGIIKIDPKTLKPITDKPAVPDIPSCSDISEMKINQSTVPIFNPLRTQKSQTSPKIDRRSPKTIGTYQDIQNSPKSPKDRNSPKINSSKPLNSPTSKKDKLSLNFTPPNPFIPNLASPNVAPNQFLYPNYHTFDPRIITNLPAYHSLPFSMFYSQPRLNYPGLSSQNLQLSPNLMSSLNLEVNKTLRKNFDIPTMMQLSPPPDMKKPATLVKSSRESYTEEKNNSVVSEKCVENKTGPGRNVKSEKSITKNSETKPLENNNKKEETQTHPKKEPEQKKTNEQESPPEKNNAVVAVSENKTDNPEKGDTVVKTKAREDKDIKEESESKSKETIQTPNSDEKTCKNTTKTESVTPYS